MDEMKTEILIRILCIDAYLVHLLNSGFDLPEI